MATVQSQPQSFFDSVEQTTEVTTTGQVQVLYRGFAKTDDEGHEEAELSASQTDLPMQEYVHSGESKEPPTKDPQLVLLWTTQVRRLR
jgi:hypothetical protein